MSDPNIGLIRLQWWRDTIESGLTDGAAAIRWRRRWPPPSRQGGLPKQALLDLVTAREFDLFQDRMPGLIELEAYMGEAYSRLIMLAAMILDRDAAPKASECAGLAGVAQGLALVMGDPAHRDPFLPVGMTVAEALGHAQNRLAQAMTFGPPCHSPCFRPCCL